MICKFKVYLVFTLLLILPNFIFADSRRSRSRMGSFGEITNIVKADIDGLSILTINGKTYSFCEKRRCNRNRRTIVSSTSIDTLIKVNSVIGFTFKESRRGVADYDLKSIYPNNELIGIINKCTIRRKRLRLNVIEKSNSTRAKKIRVSYKGDKSLFETQCKPGEQLKALGKRKGRRKFIAESIEFGNVEPDPIPTISPTIEIPPTPNTTSTPKPQPTVASTPTLAVPTISPTTVPTIVPTAVPTTVVPTIAPTPNNKQLLPKLPINTPKDKSGKTILPEKFSSAITFSTRMGIQEGCKELGGFGEARLMLWEKEKIATVEFEHSNMSGPMVAAHIHTVSDGSIFFDLDVGAPTIGRFIVWKIEDGLEYTATEKINLLKEFGLYVNVHTAKCPAGEVKGIFQEGDFLKKESSEVTYVPNSKEDVARFLNQATFGATIDLVSNVSKLGISKYLNSQLNIAKNERCNVLRKVNAIRARKPNLNQKQIFEEAWFDCLLSSPADELCHRVAFALSQQWVVSGARAETNKSEALAVHHEILKSNCFGNIRDIMQEVTLSAPMGIYLDMLNNSVNEFNENYARELLQLFTIGLEELRGDGSVIYENKKPKETYVQKDITELARILTGWTWGDTAFGRRKGSWTRPMKVVLAEHDIGEKNFLGVKYPANMNPTTELNLVLDNIFKHRNICPFTSKNLIKQLVTSNPTAAYVKRVSDKCENDGNGIRGSLKAIVRAILTDPEARDLTKVDLSSYGKLRQPLMLFTQFLKLGKIRGKGKNSYNGCSFFGPNKSLEQVPFFADTVFNYFTPHFSSPYGDVQKANLVTPEFEILNKTSIVSVQNFLSRLVLKRKVECTNPDKSKVLINYDFSDLDALNNKELVDTLDLVLTGSELKRHINFKGLILESIRNEKSNVRRVAKAISSFLASQKVMIRK